MRILCLAVITPDYPQLLTKFHHQATLLKALEQDTHAFVVGRPGPTSGRTEGFRYLRLAWNKARYLAAFDAVCQTLKPDVVYFRYPGGDEPLLRFMRRHGNVVLEHNTIELTEYQNEELDNEQRFGAAALAHAAGLVGVTGEILDHERQRGGGDVPGWVMGNGVDPASVQPVHFSLPDDAVHMLCAARFADWHGIDRLLRGMAARPDCPVVLHMAGDGEELAAYLSLSETLGLGERVRFHGFLAAPELDALTARCHLGVGTLGLHRKGLLSSASLKHRHYCLQGLPFFYAGGEEDFEPAPEFVHVFSSNDEPLDLTPLLKLAASVTPAMRTAMRRYGEERLSWSTKMAGLHGFLQQCAARPRTPVFACGASESLTAVIVCPNRNAPEVAATRASLAAQVFRHAQAPSVETLVVDAADCPAGWGEAAALNAGIARAQGQWILPLRAGETVRADLADTLCMSLKGQPELNMLSVRAQTSGHAEHADAADSAGTPVVIPPLPELQPDTTPPGLCLFRRSLWEDIGPLETAFDNTVFGASFPGPLHWRLFRLHLLPGALVERILPRVCLFSPTEPTNPDAAMLSLARDLVLIAGAAVLPVDAVLAAHDRLRVRLGNVTETLPRTLPERHWLTAFVRGLQQEGRGALPKALRSQQYAEKLCPETEWQPHLRLFLLYSALGRKGDALRHRHLCSERNIGLRLLFSSIK